MLLQKTPKRIFSGVNDECNNTIRKKETVFKTKCTNENYASIQGNSLQITVHCWIEFEHFNFVSIKI